MNVTCTCIGRDQHMVQTGHHWSGCAVSKLPLWARRTIRNASEERRAAVKEVRGA